MELRELLGQIKVITEQKVDKKELSYLDGRRIIKMIYEIKDLLETGDGK